MKSALLLSLFLVLLALPLQAQTIYDIKLKDIDGRETSLAAYKGKVLLIVNVASKCGFTRQYTGLEALHQQYRDRGLVVLGFPCNQFGGQEPGTNDEIKQFCSSQFNVTFPLFDKIEVNGDKRHPLYAQLAGPTSPYPGNIKWNFTKFLISRDGTILNRFDSKVAPESEELKRAIESALAKP
jgi:glutathione peroxidase